MANPAPREVSWIIARIRNFFGQRNVKNACRFETNYSARNQPPPALPFGPSHRLSTNHYYTRDGRRECGPPQIVYMPQTKAISAGEQRISQSVGMLKSPKPGFGYSLESGKDHRI
ncbi:hypothetical protein LSH36_190g03030 [Paralvinella palmiformis]|uniref:NADH dehydrogenase [ubiquinone] 1 alpha subcomplex subunit 7 n=1 Tax=Paralvinella palmiformis TaxID=53620 RepID=A0AAD9JQT5_9ANNE|nr:hypothetical protein LSH36_190g03030 [Paralvinella palmiformis]